MFLQTSSPMSAVTIRHLACTVEANCPRGLHGSHVLQSGHPTLGSNAAANRIVDNLFMTVS